MKIQLQEKDKIYFTSDFHIYHSNVLKFDSRSFDDVKEMNDTLLENWNKTINKDDIVFYLGDLSFGSFHRTKEFVDQLNGTIHYVLGNHDKERDIRRLDRFETISDMVDLYILDEDVKPNFYQTIVLCHYPILSWNKANHGSMLCHGHTHQNMTKDSNYDWYYKRKVIDVGCNGYDYTPISYNQVKEIMKQKEEHQHH